VLEQYVFVAPDGKRYSVTVSNEPGTEEELRQEQAEKLRHMSPLERSMAAANTENFAGNDRKAAKTSISAANVESFSNVGDLLASLPDDSSMLDHQPPITKDATSNRVTEEQRNVLVDAFIYAAKSESDNDFHLILGTNGTADTRQYLNGEVSGLPRTGPARATLSAVREKFKAQFASHPIGSSYHQFNPPIPVRVSGSLFYDVDHAPGVVGPGNLKPTTSWEIHPITNIEF
jgi:hypothetical protein